MDANAEAHRIELPPEGPVSDPVLRPEDHEARHPSTLNLSTRCNQRCTYCAGYGLAPLSEEEIRERLSGRREVVLQGGEPTLQPDLLRYVRLAKSRGCETVTLVTNGLRLAYASFAQACLAAGVDRFLVALPSHRPETCAALTRVERSFALKVQGLRNLERLGAGRRVRLVHVLVAQNAGEVDGFARFVADELPFVEGAELKLVQCLGNVEENWSVMPSLTELRRPLEDALQIGRGRGVRLTVTGIPPCVYPLHHACATSCEMRRAGIDRMSGHEPLPTCAGCPLADACVGPRIDYVKIFGTSELEAARRALDARSPMPWPPAPARRRPLARRLTLTPDEAWAELTRTLRASEIDAALLALRALLRVRGCEPAAAQLSEPGHLVEGGSGGGSRCPALSFAGGFDVTFDGELREGSVYFRDFAVLVHGSPDRRAAQRLFAQDVGRLLASGDRLTLTRDVLAIARSDRLVASLALEDPGACRLVVQLPA